MRKLIAVITCHKNTERQQACRDTWVPAAREHGFDVLFFVGDGYNPQVRVTGDVVTLPVFDDYRALPAKVRAACNWAAYNEGYDLMLKTDDDCYLVPNKLARLAPRLHNYVGRFKHPCGGYPAWYASGFAYWLSNYSMKVLARAALNGDWAEDRWVGNALAFAGVFGMSDMDNYAPWSPPLSPLQCVHTNISHAAVFCEFPNPDDMRQLHALHQARRLDRLFFEPDLHAPKMAYVSQADFMKQATDAPPRRKDGPQ